MLLCEKDSQIGNIMNADNTPIVGVNDTAWAYWNISVEFISFREGTMPPKSNCGGRVLPSLAFCGSWKRR